VANQPLIPSARIAAARRRNVFDIPLLAARLQLAAGWLKGPQSRVPGSLPLGFFGASTGGRPAASCRVVHAGCWAGLLALGRSPKPSAARQQRPGNRLRPGPRQAMP
jgi:hypothetical protein